MKQRRIVTIGGGTGSFTLLSGLKKYPVNLSAIVSMADDGGSTGVLRDELGVLPPGDVRQCLVALSESSDKMRELMNYRFEKGDLKGHNFGNILVSALEKTCGSLPAGIREASEILKIRGEILPVTEDNMRLIAELENGKKLHGEDALDGDKELREDGVMLKKLSLRYRVRPNEMALKRIKDADAIILGPGDQFGSIMPNLLVPGMAQAIRKSRALVVYICSLTNKKGLTTGWNLDAYVRSLEERIGYGRIDFVLYNTKSISGDLLRRYERMEGKGSLVEFHPEDKRTYKVVRANILRASTIVKSKSDPIAVARSFIRHDSDKLAKAIMLLLEMEGQKVIEDVV